MEENIKPEENKLREISDEELAKIIDDHKKWLKSSGEEGKQADLSFTILENRNLQEAELGAANLQGATLYNANLQGVNLAKANLQGAMLVKANLKGAVLSYTNLLIATLNFANLQGANLFRADLRGANISYANLNGAQLKHTNVQGTILFGANLERAYLRDVKGLELDSNFVAHTQFSDRAKDKWSVLRRSYSGPMFFLHLIFLIAFILPYIAKTGAWYGVSQTEQTIQQFHGSVKDFSSTLTTEENRIVGEVVNKLIDKTEHLVPDTANGWREFSVWEVLIALDKDYSYFLTALAIIIYNILRGFLTWRVTAIRDAEERSKFSPARKDYLWLYYFHYGLRILFLVSVGSFIYHAYDWLGAPLLLPPVG